MEKKKTLKPVNQKTVYSSFADLYEKLMNEEIPIDKAEAGVQALAGMNRTFALEIKYAELKNNVDARRVESVNFEEEKD